LPVAVGALERMTGKPYDAVGVDKLSLVMLVLLFDRHKYRVILLKTMPFSPCEFQYVLKERIR
jgi:hypothetical protein